MSEHKQLIDRVEDVTGWKIKPYRFKLVEDTSDWMNIIKGDVIRLDGVDYAVRGNMRETRFGIEDQPKYWVFSVIELATGKEKIIKTVFNEEFYAHIGIFKIRCYRSPDKESRALELVKGDSRFMQGRTELDSIGNNCRILDYIRGKSIFQMIPLIDKKHEEYFYEDLPGILHKLKESFTAIQKLHENGLCHGDIRNDHILIDADTGEFKWIDFDLNQDVTDFDLWSIGNIVSYVVAKGIITFDIVLKSLKYSDDVKLSLQSTDGSAFYQYRIMNLKKILPFIPPQLDRILRHFLIRPDQYYRNLDEFLEDYNKMLDSEF
ncbi:MAG: hypothetical protein ACLFR2_10870 [Candidatus Kapaibacterium sp.]